MNEAYLTDDVSLRKNDFFIHLAQHMSVYWVVCAEFRRDKKAKNDVQHEESPRKWRTLAAYPYLKKLDINRLLTDESLWRNQLPGITGLNTAEYPKAKDERATYLRSVVDEANALSADIVFWDLSTGIATRKMNEDVKGRRNADPCYIYWDELRQVVDSTNGVTCVYQHHRQYTPWESVWKDFDSALGATAFRYRNDLPLMRTIARAKAVFIAQTGQKDKLNEISKYVDLYRPGIQPAAVEGKATMDNQ